jgi:hypothetical protein
VTIGEFIGDWQLAIGDGRLELQLATCRHPGRESQSAIHIPLDNRHSTIESAIDIPIVNGQSTFESIIRNVESSFANRQSVNRQSAVGNRQ